MLSALGHLLPIALAAALSSVPIMATIVILMSPNRNSSAVPFLIGWVVGTAAVVSIGSFCARFLRFAPTRAPQFAIGVAEIVIGTAVVGLAVWAWRRALRNPSSSGNRWLRAVASLRPLPALGSGFALNLRPKGLLLGAAAGLSLAGEALLLGDAVVVVIIYLVIATSTVVAPIVVTLAAPERMEPRLAAARAWLTEHSRTVTAVVMMLVGVVIIGSGMTRL